MLDLDSQIIKIQYKVREWNCFSFQIELDTWNSHDNENQNSLQINLLLIHVCKGYKPKTVHSVRERTDRGP